MLGNVFTGALLIVSMRWIDRVLAIISTLVLARLLTPADFGIVAMASVVMGLIDVLLDLGVVPMLVQKRDCDDEDFSNGWTVRLLQAALVGALMVLFAPLASDFYHDDRVGPVLQLMALSILVSGFENIGVVNFQKNMQFTKDFQFFFLRRLCGFTATLTLALWLQTYWALPLGALVGRLGGVAVSYALHPFRPRLTLSRFRHIWSFSQWMLLRNSGEYFATRLDKFLVGHRTTAAVVGAYTLADEISLMPTTELLMPLSRVLFPALVQVRDNPAKLHRAYILALAVQALVAIPAAVGLAVVAHDVVLLLLGERWMGAVPFVQVLAPVYGLDAISFAAAYLLLTLGRVRILALCMWFQIAVFGLGAVTLFGSAPPLALAQWRLAVALLYTLGFLVLVFREVPSLHPREVYGAIWRPLAAAALMAALLPLLALEGWPLLTVVVTRCLAGAFLYTTALLALWALAGRPPGAETYLLDKLSIILGRLAVAPRSPD